MAKKGNRQLIGLVCSVCKNRNYTSSKNVVNIKDKITLQKFCRNCQKQTQHSEISKLS